MSKLTVTELYDLYSKKCHNFDYLKTLYAKKLEDKKLLANQIYDFNSNELMVLRKQCDHLTIRISKLQEFQLAAEGKRSQYWWAVERIKKNKASEQHVEWLLDNNTDEEVVDD